MADKRPETGVMQFGDDWPGIFIRGDNAMAFALNLEAALKVLGDKAPRGVALAYSESLVKLLKSCDARTKPEVQRAILEK
jgi:hypothetical protein